MATDGTCVRWLVLDRRALAYAVVLEAVLLVLAAFGGPHGALGAWTWMLQLPGIVLVFAFEGDSWFLWRVASCALVQVGLWYLVFAAIRRRNAA
jgi:hypothetical protein